MKVIAENPKMNMSVKSGYNHQTTDNRRKSTQQSRYSRHNVNNLNNSPLSRNLETSKIVNNILIRQQ